jgi:hypothetical protein
MSGRQGSDGSQAFSKFMIKSEFSRDIPPAWDRLRDFIPKGMNIDQRIKEATDLAGLIQEITAESSPF